MFCRKLELTYTFVRAMEEGLRLPSIEVVREIANKLSIDPAPLVQAWKAQLLGPRRFGDDMLE